MFATLCHALGIGSAFSWDTRQPQAWGDSDENSNVGQSNTNVSVDFSLFDFTIHRGLTRTCKGCTLLQRQYADRFVEQRAWQDETSQLAPSLSPKTIIKELGVLKQPTSNLRPLFVAYHDERAGVWKRIYD